jgi:hypothetical protein
VVADFGLGQAAALFQKAHFRAITEGHASIEPRRVTSAAACLVPGGIFEAALSMNATNIFVRYVEGHVSEEHGSEAMKIRR